MAAEFGNEGYSRRGHRLVLGFVASSGANGGSGSQRFAWEARPVPPSFLHAAASPICAAADTRRLFALSGISVEDRYSLGWRRTRRLGAAGFNCSVPVYTASI